MSETAKHFINTKQTSLFLYSKHLVSLFEQTLLTAGQRFFKIQLFGNPVYPAQPTFCFLSNPANTVKPSLYF